MSNDVDFENHPIQISYDAGVKLAKRKPNLDDATVRASARNAEDSEAFVDMSINEDYEYEKEGGFDHLSA